MSKHLHQHTDIMLDLETLGTGNNAAIVSIGAVAFMADEPGQFNALFTNSPELLERSGLGFHRRIDLPRSKFPGDIDPISVEWWLTQSDAARAALLATPRVTLGTALDDFTTWIEKNFNKPRKLRLWSNGPTFDEIILRAAFTRYGVDFPLSYRASRCCRTMIEMAELHGWQRNEFKQLSSDILKHNALHDAVFQARGVMLQRSFIRTWIGETIKD